MIAIIGTALAVAGATISLKGELARRRAVADRRSGRRPDPAAERRAARTLTAGLLLLTLAVFGLLRG